MNSSYDVVIIGSGLGGLECGVILSKEGYNVCVLEQSDIFGGCLQSFSRKGRSIDTGIHYIGSMDHGQIMRQYFKYFNVFDKLSITKLDDDFDCIRLGDDNEYNFKHGYDNFVASFADLFPNERQGLVRYCDKIKEIGSSIGVDVHKTGRFSAGNVDNLSISAAAFIDDCVSDQTLRSILAGTNVLYGGVESASNLYHHAMINHSNIEGAYRFVGGTQNVADLLVQQIIDNGGTVLNRSKVISIKAKGADVKAVELSNSEVIYGKYFISDIHPAQTFNMLEECTSIKKAYKTRLNSLPNTYGLFSVYLLMKPNSFPYLNKNYYYYHTSNVWDSILDSNDLMPRLIMLSTQLGNIGGKYSDVVTLMSPIDFSLFEKWENSSFGNRTDEYNEFKNKITDNIIDYTSRFYPEIKSSIDSVYSASPLTYTHYTGTLKGSAYGILKGYKNTISTLLPARTKMNNMFLTGQNLNVHGALGVTLTAAATCSELIGIEYLAKKIGEV